MGDADYINQIRCGDSRDLSFIPDGVISLTCTSPMYLGAGMKYDVASDQMTTEEYIALHRDVWGECHRVTRPGGRIVVNVANSDRKPYVRLNALHASILAEVGWTDRGEVIWNKPGASKRGSTAWGSWMSPSAPSLRDQHEYLLVFQKGDGPMKGDKKNATIARQEFMDYTMSVWDINPEFASKTGHPAPFPVELPMRAIKLWTYRDDLVLDPFNGWGTTCLAAEVLGRRWVGVDKSSDYCDRAKRRIDDYRRQMRLPV